LIARTRLLLDSNGRCIRIMVRSVDRSASELSHSARSGLASTRNQSRGILRIAFLVWPRGSTRSVLWPDEEHPCPSETLFADLCSTIRRYRPTRIDFVLSGVPTIMRL
jgi:hypothetical protein